MRELGAGDRVLEDARFTREEEDGVVGDGEWWCGCCRARRTASRLLRLSLRGKMWDSPWIGLDRLVGNRSRLHGPCDMGRVDVGILMLMLMLIRMRWLMPGIKSRGGMLIQRQQRYVSAHMS